MDVVLPGPANALEQDRQIALTVARERGRLLALIRASVAEAADAEDILQETLYELVAAYRMMQPIEHAGAWLARVARNRIVDRFRRKHTRAPPGGRRDADEADETDETDVAQLPGAAVDDPESELTRALLLAEIEAAVQELPPEQREAFIAHELEGLSFRELAARSGTGVNTLLSRKHYAVRFLRERLREAWEDWIMT
jgi:RNA polymerase sigma factor (sigma-70 family)